MSQLNLLSGEQKAIPQRGQRIELDAYYTPDRVARAAVGVLPIEPGDIVWEPHVGGGAWARALLSMTEADVWVSDIDPSADGLSSTAYLNIERQPHRRRGGVDFAVDREWDGIADWIIGNPPYNLARLHVERAINATGRHVVMLLRLAFVESAKRIDFWQRHPARHIWMLASRPSFTVGGGTDSAAYGLFWWDKHHHSETTCTPCWDWKL